MSIVIECDTEGRMIKNVDSVTGYWCTLSYWPNDEWKEYQNSEGFSVQWTADGKRVE